MAGFEHDPENDVTAIRRLLDQYADGFAFVKELIQNANDGGSTPDDGATNLRLHWHPGLANNAVHPLLKGPALLAVNNGPFHLKDRDGLMRMGLGSGAADPDRVGRFGLGMKAAFHVCEGFFFLEHTAEPELREFCTPWHPKYYQSWEIARDASDWNVVRQTVSELVSDWKRWFCVWIPLRRRDHIADELVPIKAGDSAFPGDQASGCPDSLSGVFQEIAPRASELLIFLNRLQTVVFTDGTQTHEFTREDAGEISPNTRYFRADIPEDPAIAKAWQSKPAWPKVFGVGKRHERVNVPDKARWSGGVAISVNDDQPKHPHLRIFWSVFLPVGNAPCSTIPLHAGHHDIHLFIHGFFFLNDSRTAILGTDDAFLNADEKTESGIRIAWNKDLATSEMGVLRRLIPCLEQMHAAAVLDALAFESVVGALAICPWYQIYRQWVTASEAFGRFLLPGGEWSWKSVPTGNAPFIAPNAGTGASDSELLVSSLLTRPLPGPLRIAGSEGLVPANWEKPWHGEHLKSWVDAIWPRSTNFTAEEAGYLRDFLLAENVDPASSDAWKVLPIYEVEEIAAKTTDRVNTTWIEVQQNASTLFAPSSHHLIDSLVEACPEVRIWIARSGMPPGILLAELDTNAVADVILRQEKLSSPGQRKEQVERLLPSANQPKVRKAIRYLLHGSWPHANNGEALLLFRSEDWFGPLSSLTELLGTGWAWIDAEFKTLITDSESRALHCLESNADAFRDLCTTAFANQEVDLTKANLHLYHDFLLTGLAQGDKDHQLLARLPIHRIDENHFTPIEQDVWLEPEDMPVSTNLDLWSSLRQSARIVKRASNLMVRAAQTILFSDRILDRDGVLRLAANRDNPSIFCELILECLSHRTPSRVSADALRASAWLPLNGGRACKMDRVVWLGESDSHTQELLRNLGNASQLFSKHDLAIDFGDETAEFRYRRTAWKTLTNPASPLLPAGDELVERLREPIAAMPTLHLGVSVLGPGDTCDFGKALDGVSQGTLPTLGLVKSLWATGSSASASAWHSKIADLFFVPWTGTNGSKYDLVLKELTILHREAGSEQQQRILRCFNRYLEQARISGRWESLRKLDGCELLNAAGEWKPVRQLTHATTGIDDSARLLASSAVALGFEREPKLLDLGNVEVLEEAQGNKQVMDFLADYAERLGERLSLNQWGLLLSLMGPNARDLADKVTEGRTDSIRVDLVGPDRSPPRIRLVRCNYHLELVKDEIVEVESLAGSVFNAPLSREITSFLVPKFSDGSGSTRYFDHFESKAHGEWLRCAFRDPDLMAGLGPSKISECLEKTIRILQKEVLGVEPTQLNAVASMLQVARKFDQLGIRMAQQEMLGAARMQLSQLAFRPSPGTRLAEAVKLLDAADQLKAQAREERDLGFGDPAYNEREAKSREEGGLQILRSCFEQDPILHASLSSAMSKRIVQEQYRAEAVAFELFQNADDAYLEYGADQGIFCADFGRNVFRFAHWGRPINEPATDDPEVEHSQKRDLVKMLVLHGSDKGIEASDGRPTGKFGLGFKSVFLLTDTPSIVSRDLAVRVRCGFFPIKLEAEKRAELSGWLASMRPNLNGGTAVQLPLRSAEDATCCQRFCTLAGYLPILSKRIREIRITGDYVPPLTARWQPEQQWPAEQGRTWHVEMGRVMVGDAERRVIVIRQGEISWIFGYEDGALRSLPDLPCIWITAPTLEASDLGFAVNGPFEPDPGRTRLSSGQEGENANQALLLRAADLLSDFFAWLMETTPQIDGLPFDPKSFWTGAWRLFSKFRRDEEGQSARNRLLASIWRCDTGYGRTLMRFPVLPNEISDDANELSSVTALRFQTSGFLDEAQGRAFLRDLLSWEDVWSNSEQVRIHSNEVVSSRMASVLANRIADFAPLPALTVAALLTRLKITSEIVDARSADRLGRHLTKAKLFPETPEPGSYAWKDDERKAFAEALDLLKFGVVSGSPKPAKMLLLRMGGGHEGLRAALAPDDRVLADSYNGSYEAVAFFRLCRGDMTVTPAELCQWLAERVRIGDRQFVRIALDWLASDDSLISESLRLFPRDLEQRLLESDEFGGLSVEARNRVELAFKGSRLEQARKEGREWNDGPPHQTEMPPEPSPQLIEMDEILDEWNPEEALLEFTVAGPLGKLIVPEGGGDEAIAARLRKVNTLEGKAAWYRLLCLGCSFSTLQGTTPRERVIGLWRNRLQDDFWKNTIPQSLESAATADYNRNLDAFFEGVIHRLFTNSNASGEDAEFWRRVFYDFRKMHYFVFRNHLPETILAYTSFTQVDGPGLINFLKSGEILDVVRDPSQPRFTGVIGQSMSSPLFFIMRELARLGVIDERFASACYYMNRPARRIASRLGWIHDDGFTVPTFDDLIRFSEQVHERIQEEAPELLGYYDLPLQWYALSH